MKTETSFFGYQAQSMPDAVLGIPVVFDFMPADKNDNPRFIPLLQKAQKMYD